MGKIIFEDRTDPKAAREQYIESLADSLYYAAAHNGFAIGMTLDEIVISILLTAADITVYSKAIGLIDDQRFAELEAKAKEMAEARQKSLDERGLLDAMKQYLAESRKKPGGQENA